MGYLANFMVYTLAMVGVLMVALFIFKNVTGSTNIRKSKYLSLIDILQISPRKNLYIISAGNEKFLIAGDAERTTLIAKLNPNNEREYLLENAQTGEMNVFPDRDEKLSASQEIYDNTYINDFRHSFREVYNNGNKLNYNSVLKNLVKKMNTKRDR